jgi:hypothetical protein
MLVFIDESGDAGLKISSGSSECFIVTLVIFQDHDDATATDQRIDLLRTELNLRSHFEFKFNKLSSELREQFLRAISPHNFFYFSIVINKKKLTSRGFQYKESFYKYTCSLVFENAKAHLDEAIVVIDGSGSREFRQQLEAYLKKRVNDKNSSCRHIKKIKLQNSISNNLLQLADMICGAVARSYKNKRDARMYRGLIKHREYSVQFWPK